MKKLCVLALACVVSAAAQAVLVDDFSDGNMSEYVQTVVLDNGSQIPDVPQTVFSSVNGTLQASIAAYDGIEQALCLRDDYSLGIGEILKVGTTGFSGGNQDLGLVVAATKNQTPGVRQDYLFITLRGDRSHWLSRQFTGTVESSYTQDWPGLMDAIYIERIDIDTFETGYYIGNVKTMVRSMDVTNTAVGTAIGFYSDMRAANTLSGLDNLQIIPEPATMLLLGLGGLLAARKRKHQLF